VHAVAWYDADADSISLSVNGEAPVTVPATFTSGFQNTSDDGYLLIGSLYNHALFDGSIDDVAMWKKVLSDTERQALFENNPHRHTTTGGGNGGGGGGRAPSGSGDTVIVDNDDGSTALAAGQFRLYRGNAVRSMITADFKKAFEEVDLVATPTTPSVAFKIGEKTSDPVSMYLEDIFTVTANLTGMPAISVPCGISKVEGVDLPIGLQLTARHGDEGLLFEACKDLGA
jgi:Asp-tRNA(Asn)/Glu-tRNA(Gln) amidotransferase A subunit family amidase